jgi:hypothetical protein
MLNKSTPHLKGVLSRTIQAVWQGTADNAKDPSRFGTLILEGQPDAEPAGKKK